MLIWLLAAVLTRWTFPVKKNGAWMTAVPVVTSRVLTWRWDGLWQFFQLWARTEVFGNFGSLVGCVCLPGAYFHSKTIVLI
jgi:hypothetical protein